MSDPVETVPPKKKKTEPVGFLMSEALRDEAAAMRAFASALLGAELAGEWPAVAAVRGELVATAHELEALAEREHPRG